MNTCGNAMTLKKYIYIMFVCFVQHIVTSLFKNYTELQSVFMMFYSDATLMLISLYHLTNPVSMTADNKKKINLYKYLCRFMSVVMKHLCRCPVDITLIIVYVGLFQLS